MATTIGKLNFMVAADASGVSTGLSKAGSDIQQFNSQVTSIAGRLAGVFGGVSIAGLTGWGVKLAADAEQAQVAFSTMLGSGDAAVRMLKELRDMGKETPFEFPELRDSAKTLVAFGMAQENVLGTLRALGDVSAGTGKNIQELTLIYGQAMAAGRLMTQDMNQLTAAGIPILQALADHFGVTKQEIRKMVEEGKVDFQTFDQVFRSLSDQGGMYFNMMSDQSETLTGRWSTLKDTAGELALQVGESLLPTLKSLTEVGISTLEWVKNLDTNTVRTVISITSMTAAFAATAAVIPRVVTGAMSIVRALRAIAVGQSIVQALSGPKGWLAIAAGMAAAVAAGAAVNAMFDGVEKKATAAVNAAKTAKDAVDSVANTSVAVKLDTQPAEQSLKSLKKELSALKKEERETKKRFDDLIKAQKAVGGKFTGAAERFTMDGLKAVFRGSQEGVIQQEVRRLREEQKAALDAIRVQEQRVEAAIKAKDTVKVQEGRI